MNDLASPYWWSAALRWFRPPVFADEERSAAALVFWKVAFGVLGIWAGFLLLLIAMEAETLGDRMRSIVVVASLVLLLIELNRRAHTRLASCMLVFGLIFHTTVRAWNLGGIGAPFIPIYVVLVLMAGLLLGARGGLCAAIACALGSCVLAAGTANEMIPPVQFHQSVSSLIVFALFPVGITLLLLNMISNTLRERLLRAQVELRERQRVQLRLDLALRAANIAVWELDLATGEIEGDPVVLAQRGVPMKGRIVDAEAWNLRVPPEDAAEVGRQVERVRSGETQGYRVEYRLRDDNGKLHYMEVAAQAAPSEEGQSPRIVGVNIDATAHKEAERALRERVKELRLLHDVAKLTQQGDFRLDELPARIAPMLPDAWQHPDCCEARVSLAKAVAHTPEWRETPWMQSIAFDTEAGKCRIDIAYTEERPVEHEGPFLREERELLESLAEMLVTYMNWRSYRESLEVLVATRTEELRGARDIAETANRAKSAFLANMSHEIRTPLNAVLGYSQLLLLDRGIDAESRKRVAAIQRSGTHLLGLINDVLDLSKIEAGHLLLKPRIFNTASAFADVAGMFNQQLSDRGIAFGLEFDGQLPPVLEADVLRIRQVLVNLVGNAAKFTERGRILVKVSAEPAAGQQVRVRVEVEDTGCGIEAADVSRVFEAFEQGARGARAGGTGLGISISRRLARAMGGDITLESTMGRGSCFRFTFLALVRTAAPAEIEGRIPVGLEPVHRGTRVLVVDDIETNSEVLSGLLRPLGFDVRCVATATAALAEHDAWRPHLVLMDLRLPDFDGREAIERLRAAGAKTPVMVVTASSTSEDEGEVYAAGANDFLPKPFAAPVLYEKIARLLGIGYLYEEAATPEFAAPAAGPPESLPATLRREIADATRSARIERLETLLERAREEAPFLARRLAALADSFQFEALLNLVENGAAT